MQRRDDIGTAFPGAVQITLRNGWKTIVALTDVANVKARREGGAVIYTQDDRLILVDRSVDEVLAAMKGAGHGAT